MTRPALLLLAVLATAACGGTRTVTRTVTVAGTAKTDVGAPSEFVLFGYIKSLRSTGKDFELRFDPAWFLMGTTANIAAAEDGKVEPGEPVPNDNYRLDEGHRVLTYRVPADARVTVLKTSPRSAPSTVAELAQIVSTGKPRLWEPLETGVWLRVRIDTVRSIDQQYQP